MRGCRPEEDRRWDWTSCFRVVVAVEIWERRCCWVGVVKGWGCRVERTVREVLRVKIEAEGWGRVRDCECKFLR